MTHSHRVRIKLRKLHDDVQIPEYKHIGDAGMDVRAYFDQDFLNECWMRSRSGEIKMHGIGRECTATLSPHTTICVPTGIQTEIPMGYEIQIRPRSGLAAKDGATVLNSPGTVDSGYRGEYKVILHSTNKHVKIKHGDRIAQIVLVPICKIEWEEVAELESHSRGDGGFGSTGVS